MISIQFVPLFLWVRFFFVGIIVFSSFVYPLFLSFIHKLILTFVNSFHSTFCLVSCSLCPSFHSKCFKFTRPCLSPTERQTFHQKPHSQWLNRQRQDYKTQKHVYKKYNIKRIIFGTNGIFCYKTNDVVR